MSSHAMLRIAMPSIAVLCSAMHCIAMQCHAMLRIAMQRYTLQRNAMQCYALHINALHCKTMHSTAMLRIAMHWYASHCKAMLCYAYHCNPMHKMGRGPIYVSKHSIAQQCNAPVSLEIFSLCGKKISKICRKISREFSLFIGAPPQIRPAAGLFVRILATKVAVNVPQRLISCENSQILREMYLNVGRNAHLSTEILDLTSKSAYFLEIKLNLRHN